MKKGADGYYRKVFTFDGKTYSVRAKTEELLWQKVAEKKLGLKNGTLTVNENTLVERWLDEYLETYKLHAISEKQYSTYTSLAKNYVKPYIGKMRVRDVRPVHLQRVMNGCAGQSLSQASKLRNLLRMVFKQARKNRMITDDPAEDLELPTTTNGTHRPVTEDERKYILQLCETHRAGLWVLTMLYCGLRPAEANALRWDCVDLPNRVMHVLQAIESGTDRVKTTKTEAGIRAVPIPDPLIGRLQEAWAKVEELPEDDDRRIYVFTQPTTGKHHTHTSYIQMWGTFKRQLDILMGAKTYRGAIIPETSVVADDLVPYCLRHTYGTDLQTAGVPINVARELLGHDDIKVTSKIYTHLSDQAFQEASIRINKHHANRGENNTTMSPAMSPAKNG